MTFDLIPIQWLFCCNGNQANSKVRHYNYLSLFCCVLEWVAGWWRVIQSELNDCSNRTAPVTLWKHHHLTLWPSGSVILSHTHTHTSTSLLKACMLTQSYTNTQRHSHKRVSSYTWARTKTHACTLIFFLPLRGMHTHFDMCKTKDICLYFSIQIHTYVQYVKIKYWRGLNRQFLPISC